MSLKLTAASSGYLEMAAKIVSAFPCTIIAWVGFDSSYSYQVVAGQMQSNADRYAMGWLDASGSALYASMRNPSNGDNATLLLPAVATMRLAMFVFGATNSRKCYIGSNTEATSTVTLIDDITNHNQFTVGAYRANGNNTFFLDGNIAEVHVYSTALGDADYDSLAAGALPETITGWVDGWALETYNAGGTYLSLGGTRTLTASGGVATGTQGHPIDTSGRGGGATTSLPPHLLQQPSRNNRLARLLRFRERAPSVSRGGILLPPGLLVPA